MKRETEDTHIYFPKKVLTELRKWAKVNRRSVTAETIIAVEKYIEGQRNGTNKDKK
jgi:hypothetical protein